MTIVRKLLRILDVYALENRELVSLIAKKNYTTKDAKSTELMLGS